MVFSELKRTNKTAITGWKSSTEIPTNQSIVCEVEKPNKIYIFKIQIIRYNKRSIRLCDFRALIFHSISRIRSLFLFSIENHVSNGEQTF